MSRSPAHLFQKITVSTITRTISGDTPSSVTLLTLIRQDTQTSVAVTPPLPNPLPGSAAGNGATDHSPIPHRPDLFIHVSSELAGR